LRLIYVDLRELSRSTKIPSPAAIFRLRELADVSSVLSIRWITRDHKLSGV
jgi:hypothetical protein